MDEGAFSKMGRRGVSGEKFAEDIRSADTM
jgi:hypothetical protein